MEFLRSIPGLPYYYAGVDGEIYSTKRGILKKLKATLSDKGYRKVRPMLDGKILTRKVAVLVCSAFHGERPANMEVCHGPNGKLDDRPTNVSWGTRSKNLGEDRLRDGTSNRGDRHWTHGYRSGLAPFK